MKQLLLSALVLFIGVSSFAQSDQYTEMMKSSIPKIAYPNSVEEIQAAANQFERIANVETKEWLPAYYATIAYVTLASKNMQTGGDKIQEYVDKAKASLAKAQAIAPDNSEVLTAQGYVYLAHIWINPMVNGAKYTPIAYEAFDRAIKADPTNPRPYYLRGQNVYFTPEAFGGGKANAKPLLLKAKEMFGTFKPASDIAPVWGEGSTDYFLGLYDASE